MRVLLLIVGLVAGAAFVFFARAEGDRVLWLQAWLVAVLFWLGPALGGLLLLIVQRISAGKGALPAAAPLAALTATLPMSLLAFVPLGFGLSVLLPWVIPAPDLAGLAAQRAPWMTAPLLLVRTGAIFVVWLGLAWWAIRGPMPPRAAVAALVVALITLLLFLVDWVLGLTPRWSTELFPLVLAVGLGLTAPTLLALSGAPGAFGLARWLCGGVLLLLYLLFLQYLVVWTGNLPDQVTWYLAREGGPWPDLGIAAFCLLGIAGAAGLVWPRLLAGAGTAVLGWVLLIGEALLVVWMILPAFAPVKPSTYWLTGLAMLSLGGLWGLMYYNVGGVRPRGEAA
ncbi:MAG: hypothetical protein WCA32_24165 [Chromatiaceae bacterium]